MAGMAPPTPAKRSKRVFLDAREISSQTPHGAFDRGRFNVSLFIGSREYEIKSLLQSLAGSKSVQRKRAFQTLPRDLRRRTAAHNAKRVPKRIRSIAQKELIDDNAAIATRRRRYDPKVHRRNNWQLNKFRLSKKISSWNFYSSRDLDYSPLNTNQHGSKIWLPSHRWCAKRARMAGLWGFSLVQTPTRKSHRSTYKAASQDGCVIFDTSYYSTIMLKGSEVDLKQCLLGYLPPKDPALTHETVVAGFKASSTWLFDRHKWPTNAIAPVQVVWIPGFLRSPTRFEVTSSAARILLLRIHPIVFNKVYRLIKHTAGLTSCLLYSPQSALGSIQLVGIGVNSILMQLGLLPLQSCDRFSTGLVMHKAICGRSLAAIQAFIPEARRCVFKTPEQHVANWLPNLMSTEAPRQSSPGQEDPIVACGDIIPVMLVKHELGERSFSEPSGGLFEDDTVDCWTMHMPWELVYPVWLFLNRQQTTKLGGMDELAQLTLEYGLSCFPRDFLELNPTKRGLNLALQDAFPGYNSVAENLQTVTPELCRFYLKRPELVSPGPHPRLCVIRVWLRHRGRLRPHARIYTLQGSKIVGAIIRCGFAYSLSCPVGVGVLSIEHLGSGSGFWHIEGTNQRHLAYWRCI